MDSLSQWSSAKPRSRRMPASIAPTVEPSRLSNGADLSVHEAAVASMPTQVPIAGKLVFRFDRFEVHPGQRALLEDGRPLRIGSRAYDLLAALCRRHGEIVSTQELLTAAWPNQVVEESSVRVHIATLRKVLGDGRAGKRYITNVPLRGYCLVAAVDVVSQTALDGDVPESSAPAIENASSVPELPPYASGLVGRAQESTELLQRLREYRCVTLVGAGGIGKTSVAVPVARRFEQIEGIDLAIVELGTLTQEELVPAAVASSLGLVVSDSGPLLPAIATFLRGKRRQLLLLDNCEHLIDGVATMVEYLLDHAPNLHVLATSRESLRVKGEWVQRLESLALPPPGMQSRAVDALKYPAVELFVERAMAGANAFAMGDAEAPLVCNICRRLDGIPLAIELAAGAIEAVGLRGLVDRLGGRLGNRLVMTGRGRRTALPRHQTLRATLDWSFGLLPAEEKDLLAQLSVFRGVFTHAAACAVFDRPVEVLDVCLTALVSKSLVVSERSGDAMVYRLLETMREYAAERLAADGIAEATARRHACYLLSTLRVGGEADGRVAPSSALAALAREVDDVRAAVHWSFDSDDAQHLAVSLMAWSGPLWFSLGMLAEYRKLAERAVELIDAGEFPMVDLQEEMRLCESLGHAVWHTHGGGTAMERTFGRALAIADQLQATSYQLRCRWGLWLACNAEGDYTGSRRQAEQFGELAAGREDPVVRTHERMMALGLHFQGDQVQAKRYALRVLAQPLAIEGMPRSNGFHFDQRVAGLTVMARVLWLEGHADQALERAAEAVQEALSIDHALSLCYAIAIGAAPVAFWCGDAARARAWTDLLKHTAHERSLHFWQAFGEGYQHLLEIESRPAALDSVLSRPHGVTLRENLCTVQPAFFNQCLLLRALNMQSGWCTAELLRIHGEQQALSGALTEADATLRRSIEIARDQHALAWVLRSNISLARLLNQRGLRAEACAALESALSLFREGHGTSDVKLALHVLQNEL